MSPQGGKTPVYGFLAVMKLTAAAAGDRKLKGCEVRAFTALASFAGSDGSCIVKMDTIAAALGVARQRAQVALAVVERRGYFKVQERSRRTGQRTANLYQLNLALVSHGAACPVPENYFQPADTAKRLNRQILPPGTAPWNGRGCSAREPTGVRHQGTHGGADKKPIEETSNEETVWGVLGGPNTRGGTDSCSAKRPSGQDQRSFYLPITGGTTEAAPGIGVSARVQEHNRDMANRASGSLWTRWAKLDPDLALYDALGEGKAKVAERAQDVEARHPGRGCRYMAGAVEKATRGHIKADDILSGAYAREKSA